MATLKIQYFVRHLVLPRRQRRVKKIAEFLRLKRESAATKIQAAVKRHLTQKAYRLIIEKEKRFLAVKFVPVDFEKVKEVEMRANFKSEPFNQRIRMEKC